MDGEIVGKLGGRARTAGDLEAIREAVREANPALRAKIPPRVGEALGSHGVPDRPKRTSSRVLLPQRHRSRLIELLLPPRNGDGLRHRPVVWPEPQPMTAAAARELGE